MKTAQFMIISIKIAQSLWKQPNLYKNSPINLYKTAQSICKTAQSLLKQPNLYWNSPISMRTADTLGT